MQLRCRKNLGQLLSKKYLSIGYTEQSVLHLTVGREYVAFAISLWRGGLQILVSDDNSLPNWYPVECFEIVDRSLPADWGFAFYGHETDLEALWGYPHLIDEAEHYDALLCRDKAALRIFEDEVHRKHANS